MKCWEEHVSSEEFANWQSCFGCAEDNGLTRKDAEKCVGGDLDCKGCPFGVENECPKCGCAKKPVMTKGFPGETLWTCSICGNVEAEVEDVAEWMV